MKETLQDLKTRRSCRNYQSTQIKDEEPIKFISRSF